MNRLPLFQSEKIQTDNSVDIKVKALAEKDVSIERLKTELGEFCDAFHQDSVAYIHVQME